MVDLPTAACPQGIVAANRIAADFLPKHFGAGYDQWLDLKNGATLGPETHVTFESEGLRAAVDSVLSVVKSPFAGLDMVMQATLKNLAGVPDHDDRDHAARVVQRFVLVLLARRELARRRRRQQAFLQAFGDGSGVAV